MNSGFALDSLWTHAGLHPVAGNTTDGLNWSDLKMTSAAVAVNLAVIVRKSGGDGWESNPPRTLQQRPANGFEDRSLGIPERPLTSVPIHL
jgi:hypothetical protein